MQRSPASVVSRHVHSRVVIRLMEGSILSQMVFSRSRMSCAVGTALIALSLAAVAVAQQAGTHPVSGRVYALPMGVQGAPGSIARSGCKRRTPTVPCGCLVSPVAPPSPISARDPATSR